MFVWALLASALAVSALVVSALVVLFILVFAASGSTTCRGAIDGASGAFNGTETTCTHASGEGLHFNRSGGVNQIPRNRAACNATATPNNKNSRRRPAGLVLRSASEAKIAGDDSRYCDGAGNPSAGGFCDFGGRRSGNLMT